MRLRLLVILVAALAANTAASRELPPLIAPPVPPSIPAPVVRTLSNHLRVAVIESHALPMVTLTLVIRTGSEGDPAEIPGTAQFVASMLSEGTTSRNAQQIAEALDGMGASFDSAADWDDSWARLTVLSDHTPVAFGLLADMIEHAEFARADVARVRRQTLSALDVLRRDPGYLADTLIQRIIFAGTPYSHPNSGVEESVSRITPEELRRFHERYYQPENAFLVAAGDVTPEAALALAQRYFGGWKGREASFSFAPVRAAVRPSPSVVVIDDPDSVETEIRIANRAVSRESPSYDALTVANEVLGGPAEDALFSALRTDRGLVYGVSSRLVAHREGGAWEIETSTKTQETLKTVDLIVAEMKRLDRRGISRRELQNAQDYLVGHMALEWETPQQIAQHVVKQLVYNLPLDNQMAQKIESLSPDAVRSAAAQYLNPATAAIVLVGNAAGFGPNLKKLSPYRIVPISSIDFESLTFERQAAVTGDR